MSGEITFSEMTAFVYQVNAKLDKVLLAIASIEKKQAPMIESEYLGMEDAAAFICKSKSTLYGMVHRGEIPNSKKGKRLIFSRTDLIEFVENGRRKTVAEELGDSENALIKQNLKKLR